MPGVTGAREDVVRVHLGDVAGSRGIHVHRRIGHEPVRRHPVGEDDLVGGDVGADGVHDPRREERVRLGLLRAGEAGGGDRKDEGEGRSEGPTAGVGPPERARRAEEKRGEAADDREPHRPARAPVNVDPGELSGVEEDEPRA